MFSRTVLRALRWSSLCLAAALVGCGGTGEDSADVGPTPGTQQYPGGFWEGTVGTGASQRQAIGFIDNGVDGKGGEFYLARGATGAGGYDVMYGVLRTNISSVQATSVTYYSVQDGKFANGLTLRGTASANPLTGQTTTISGSYTSATGTAAATGTPNAFKLTYSPLNNFPGSASLIAGTYRGSGLFGGQWVFTVSPTGVLSGRVGGCNVQGRAGARAPDSAMYSITMNMTGDAATCGTLAGTQQAGVAVLRFDANNVPNGIWVFARNSNPENAPLVLNGLADARQSTIPSTTPLSAAGNWQGTLTLPAGTSGDPAIWGAILPDGGLFFYTNSSFNHNALYGRLVRYENNLTTNRFVTASDGVFFDRLLTGATGTLGGYASGVLIDLSLESMGGTGLANRLTGTYSYPDQPNGFPTGFTMQPDSLYTLPAGKEANINLIVGNYRMPGAGFGGHTVDIQVAVDGAITGETSNGCVIVGKLLPSAGNTVNLYRVEAFGYLESPTKPANTIGCELSTGPSQSGAASATFDSDGNVNGLRILAAGLQSSGQRAHTVFVGSRR